MIYLDTTSAASSAMNMGVQRTVRGVYAHLKNRFAVTPVRWDFRAKRYARLSDREQNFLDHPFASYRQSSAIPGQWDLQHWLNDWRDARTRKQRGIDSPLLLKEGNVLLIPDLCWDARIHAWESFAHFPGEKIAIFHDAMPLRIPGQADSHDALFARYVRALAQLDLVICVSREVEDDLRRYWKEFGLAPKPTHVITWPVPFTGPRPTNESNQAAGQIIYVSRLKLRKNHLVLLEACESLWSEGATFRLDLIGVEDAFTDTRKILHKVRVLASRGRPVRWRKHISDAELAEAYRDCSLTIFPSRLEGFGLPIIESLWHSRPVICGSNGAIGEVAQGGGCHQVDQNNAGELAAAIRLLLSDEILYRRLYEESRARAFRSWDDYGRELEPLLQTVTAACLLPLQSGIPRTTRGVYRLLNEHRSQHLTPIFWQPFRGGYTRLSTRARQLLDDPFSRHVPGHTPRDSTLPLLRAGLSDLMREWPQAVALPEILRKDDVLLLTSIFPDNRLEYLQRLMVVPGRKIAFFHDAIPLHDPNVSRWEKTRHLKTLRLLAQVDQVIAISEAARKDLHALWKEHGIPVEASTCALTWPVPFTSPRPAFSAPPWKTKTILYVSRLKLVKNHAALLATCEELWRGGLSFNLELIGCEDEAKESRQLIRQIRRLLEKGRSISWRAHVNEEDLHAAYQRATFTIFPSLMEGFGLPIIESLWHGRGVICSDEDAVGELSRAGGCVRVDVQDYAALTTATRELLQNEQKCLDLAKEAYARPVRSWPDYWRELEPLLEPR